MTETLNDVLSIQKIEEGKLELQYQKMVIGSVLHTVEMSLRGQLNSKRINLVIEIQPTVPHCVRADRFRIEHVLANLLSNAIKFSPLDSTIKIVAKNLNPVKVNEVTLAVIDQGVGISEENQKSLFQEYMQIK